MITYPLDLAHGKMASDMSKKVNIPIQKNEALKENLPKTKLYSSVRDCLKQSINQGSYIQSKKQKYLQLFKGFDVALLSQVPYNIILMGSFEMLTSFFE